ncbi:hypothetical protein K3495_g13349 [Podosphaera aphanis]|nr:hypothetical protein K3495_g13349 [Podosphaera aphanis]
MLSSFYEHTITARQSGVRVLLDSKQLSHVSSRACVQAAQTLLGRTAQIVHHCTILPDLLGYEETKDDQDEAWHHHDFDSDIEALVLDNDNIYITDPIPENFHISIDSIANNHDKNIIKN